MDDDSLKTGVDTLLELLKKKQKVSMSDAAKELAIDESIIKMWVDFLVEEKVIGVEYKFTKPYLYLNVSQDAKKGQIIKEERLGIEDFRKDFEKKAEASSIPQTQAVFLWRDHLLNQAEIERPFFYREARKRGFEDIDQLWEEYKKRLVAAEQGG